MTPLGLWVLSHNVGWFCSESWDELRMSWSWPGRQLLWGLEFSHRTPGNSQMETLNWAQPIGKFTYCRAPRWELEIPCGMIKIHPGARFSEATPEASLQHIHFPKRLWHDGFKGDHEITWITWSLKPVTCASSPALRVAWSRTPGPPENCGGVLTNRKNRGGLSTKNCASNDITKSGCQRPDSSGDLRWKRQLPNQSYTLKHFKCPKALLHILRVWHEMVSKLEQSSSISLNGHQING